MTTTIKIDLFNKESIRQAKKELKEYKKNLAKKCETVVSELIEVGITTAKLNCGEYGDVITFSKEILAKNANGVRGRLVAVGAPVFRMRGGELITVDSLLIAEFGSGFEARVLDKVAGVGQGTFPGQTHAFDPRGWWYTDVETGETIHSYGESPTYPMHSAMLAMIFDVDRVLREVFGNG